MATILCVDDDAAVLTTFTAILERAGHRVIAVSNAAAALNVLARGGVNAVISDYLMPDMTGLDLLEALRRDEDDVPVIMVTGHGSIEHAVEAMRAGATDYVAKPVEPRQLELVVDQALDLARLRRENRSLKDQVRQLRGDHGIVGESEPLKRVLELVRTVAPTRSTVLIQGESGTGKELVARAIHGWSDRADGPFVTVNCAALPESLIESSLFGHEKGAFTGASRLVKGAFERATGGTLLLDEVTEMRPELQAKLLRVIQEQEFERVGGSASIRVDVRIVATTNRDLQAAVRSGHFREDLFYRLAVVPVVIPPLRDRKDDIPALVRRFADRTSREIGKRIDAVTPDALARLAEHHWPGNVRELSHAVERAVILSPGPVLTADVLRPGAVTPGPGDPSGTDPATDPQGMKGKILLDGVNLKEAEEVLIREALERTGQNRTRAAELLGISIRTLRNRLNG
jgi:two-component system, NtrC family, response regulator AtoC